MNFLILKDGQNADTNGLIINFDKTKELVLLRPHVTRHNLPQSLAGIEQVLTVRLIGVIFQSSLSFAAHVDYVLKVCSQRILLLKQLRAQVEQLHTVFQAIMLQRLTYALPACGPFLSVDLKHKIDGFLIRSYRYGFTKEIFHIQTIIDSVTCDIFNKVKASNTLSLITSSTTTP